MALNIPLGISPVENGVVVQFQSGVAVVWNLLFYFREQVVLLVYCEFIGREGSRVEELVLFNIILHSAFRLLILQETVNFKRPQYEVLAKVGTRAREGETDSRYWRIRGIRVVERLEILGVQGSHSVCLSRLILKIS